MCMPSLKVLILEVCRLAIGLLVDGLTTSAITLGYVASLNDKAINDAVYATS